MTTPSHGHEAGDSPYPANPKRGDLRTANGLLLRFIERELEGDKWEVVGPIPNPQEPPHA